MSLDGEIGSHFSLSGKVTVITGAGSGLGREAARLFAVAGSAVVLADTNVAAIEQTAELVRSAGGTALLHPIDVSIPDQVNGLADAAFSACGGLDVWINSAAITLWSLATDADPQDVERVIAVNMLGSYWGCVAAGRIMKENGGGAIINVSSTAGDSPVPLLSAYGMAKAGVNQLTAVCAKELGQFGIRVNAVVPGWIDTPMNSSMYRDAEGAIDLDARKAVMTQMAELAPLGKTGEPIDIGMAMLYLASDASRFVSGHLLRVSGGV